MFLAADFHLHSCLSPCGSLESSPRAIARTARQRGLHIAALTDHNSARNCPAFAAACREQGLAALFGCEITTREEAHLLAIFGDCDTAVDFGNRLYDSLPPIRNLPEQFGDQPVVNEAEVVVEVLEKYLVAAVPWSVDQLVDMIHAAGGLAIPAHLDRASYSLVGQLGFLPDLPFDGVELIRPDSRIDIRGHCVTASSDAHHPLGIAQRHSLVPATGPVGCNSDAAFASLKAALRDRTLLRSDRQTR